MIDYTYVIHTKAPAVETVDRAVAYGLLAYHHDADADCVVRRRWTMKVPRDIETEEEWQPQLRRWTTMLSTLPEVEIPEEF